MTGTLGVKFRLMNIKYNASYTVSHRLTVLTVFQRAILKRVTSPIRGLNSTSIAAIFCKLGAMFMVCKASCDPKKELIDKQKVTFRNIHIYKGSPPIKCIFFNSITREIQYNTCNTV